MRDFYSPHPVDWAVSRPPVDYARAVAAMEARAGDIARGAAAELVWLLEHPPIYTAGTSAQERDLVTPDRFPVHRTGRGGQFTYHGPGQRVAYVMLDLNCRRRDVRAFVSALEGWLADTLAAFGVRCASRPGRVGLWVPRGEKGAHADEKIAAIGIRIRRWITFHGVSLNVDPELAHYAGIVPCGLAGYGITSLAALGIRVPIEDVDAALERAFAARFGPTVPAPPPDRGG